MTIEDEERLRAMRARWSDLLPRLNEHDRRLALAAEAKSWDYGGITAVHEATGASPKTIRRGMSELSDDPVAQASGRVRAPGGGRKKTEVTHPELVDALDSLIEPDTRGDPESPLRWTTKTTRHLAAALTGMGHSISHSVVAKLLHSLGCSLQETRKTMEGAEEFLASGDPVISVDTKKKELVGQFPRAGKEWHPRGEPIEVCPPTISPNKPTVKPSPTECTT